MTDNTAGLIVDVQIAIDRDSASGDELSEVDEPPSAASLTRWANQAYAGVDAGPTEVTIRLVEEDEMVALNRDYRGKPTPTNVLSFPVDLDGVDLLGDIVICHPVIVREALSQDKSTSNHYAHMVTHGVLHLCGFDHQNDADAEQMEKLEIGILAAQGIANPYT